MKTKIIKTRHPTLIDSDYVFARDVVFLPVSDGTARILQLGGNFYAINHIGAEMLTKTLEIGTMESVKQIALRYGASQDQVQGDLQKLLEKLERQGLICRSHVEQSDHKLKKFMANIVLTPLFAVVHRCVNRVDSAAWILLVISRLSFRLFGWSNTLSVWQRCCPVITRQFDGTRVENFTITEIDNAVRKAAAKHIVRAECKERALSCWAIARQSGIKASLIVGIRTFPFEGHCWCELNQTIFSDDHDRCDKYTPVARYA